MNKTWPKVPLRQILVPVYRPEVVHATKTYSILGAHWYGKGLYTKNILSGSEIQAKHLYRVEQGDFVYNRLFGWKGSFALATQENNSRYVSNEFPCFTVKSDIADGGYVSSYFKLPIVWEEVLSLSTGGTPTSRNRLKEEELLRMEIPLPSIEEQRRIMARIQALTIKTEAALELRRQAKEEADALCRSILSHDPAPKPTAMYELVKLRMPDVVVHREESYQFAGVYSFGRGVFRAHKKSGADFAYPRLTRLQAGNFVYPKLMAWEGALGVVPPECDGCVVSTEFPVFEVLEEKVLPEVLDTYFRTPAVWPEISGASTGTNVRRRRLNPKDFLNYCLPLPSRETQERLRRVRARVNALKSLQAETSGDLDALMPSILDKAFRGDL
jgi:type I restriction enzyme, S subunit